MVAYLLTAKKSRPSNSLMSAALDPSLFDVQTIPSWRDALDSLPPKPHPAGLSTNLRGTALPSPSLFTNSNNKRIYTAAWLAIRPVHIDNVLGELEKVDVAFPTGQQWRNFLNSLKFHLNVPSTSSEPSTQKRPAPGASSPGPSTKRQRGEATSEATPSAASTSTRPPRKQGEASRKVDGQALLNSLPLRQQRVSQICWVDKTMSFETRGELERELSDEVVSEVTWDLHEQNFRLELFMLDLMLCPTIWRRGEQVTFEVADARWARESTLRRVFPTVEGRMGNVYVTQIPNVDGGITSRNWVERGHHFKAFREVMLDWPHCPDIIRNASLDMKDEHSMIVLENVVVREYCNRFLRQFGRPPIPPVRLPFESLRRKAPASFYAALFPQRDA